MTEDLMPKLRTTTRQEEVVMRVVWGGASWVWNWRISKSRRRRRKSGRSARCDRQRRDNRGFISVTDCKTIEVADSSSCTATKI